MEDILRLEFNEWAKAGRGESMERGHRPVGEQAIEKMSVTDEARVLDVGCGSGWASRLLAGKAKHGRVVGIDISDEMIRLARETANDFSNLSFQVASAEQLPFESGEFTDAFSMESLYYYADMSRALAEIRRVLAPGGLFVNVVDLYQENKPSHQWIEKLQVPVHLLSIAEYHSLFEQTGFVEVQDERILDPAPLPDEYSGTSFRSHEDYLHYRAAGSLMLSGRAGK
ncbi:MAG TPA: class I SAM-dependent methyltransferase [Pyrinomonadaceae bacterium]|nr:class I SAM-dependent methyltransferase [Pyrinomonadaceae bacterium]